MNILYKELTISLIILTIGLYFLIKNKKIFLSIICGVLIVVNIAYYTIVYETNKIELSNIKSYNNIINEYLNNNYPSKHFHLVGCKKINSKLYGTIVMDLNWDGDSIKYYFTILNIDSRKIWIKYLD